MTLVVKLVREREIIDREKYRENYDRIFGEKPASLAAKPSHMLSPEDVDELLTAAADQTITKEQAAELLDLGDDAC